MTYRDSDAAAQARISALEAEVEELRHALARAAEHERAATELKLELEVERAQRLQQIEMFGAERQQHERTMESIQDMKIEVAVSRARAEVEIAQAEARFSRTNAELSQRQLAFAEQRIAKLHAELEAVQRGPESARLFYETRIAEVRAALHTAEAEGARYAEQLKALALENERTLASIQRDAAVRWAEELRQELARLKRGLSAR